MRPVIKKFWIENKLRPVMKKFWIENKLRPVIKKFPAENFNQKLATPLIRPKLCFVHLPPKGKAVNIAILKLLKPSALEEWYRLRVLSSTTAANLLCVNEQARIRNEQDKECADFPTGAYKSYVTEEKRKHDAVLRSL